MIIALLKAILVYSIIGSIWHIIMMHNSSPEAIEQIERQPTKTYVLIMLWPVTMSLVIIKQLRNK